GHRQVAPVSRQEVAAARDDAALPDPSPRHRRRSHMKQSTAFAETSPLDPDTLLRSAQTELSMKARLGYVALLLASLLGCAGITSLWWTEPTLPLRTDLAFGVMTLIGLAWTVFALRVLTGPRVMFVHHRIVAGRMAV